MNESAEDTAKLRLFIALPVPPAIRTELGALQQELRKRLPIDAVRWTSLEQIHLTLAFLGDVSIKDVDPLSKAAREACANFAPIMLRAERMGFFPHAQSPKVIWAWVHDDWGRLVRLQRAVALAIKPFTNQRDEDGFTAHLTIGRVRELKPAQVRTLTDAALEFESKVFGDWTADTVELMQSELKEGSHHHRRLAQFPLAGNIPK